jgi:hypothetical protein
MMNCCPSASNKRCPYQPRHDVGRPPATERDDDADRARGVLLRLQRNRAQQRAQPSGA